MVPAVLLAGSGAVALVVSPTAADVAYFLAVLAPVTLSFVLAFAVNRRVPESPVGPLIAANGVTGLILVVDVYAAAAARRPDLLPGGGDAFHGATSGTWMFLYLPLAMLLLVFPDGHLPGRRWRVVAYGLPAVAVVVNGAVALGTLWPASYDVSLVVAWTALPLFMVGLVAAGVSVRLRYRRADPMTRMRLRWILLAGTSVPLMLLLCWFSYLVVGGPALTLLGLLVMYLAVPAAAATALLRGDRVDVDSVIVSTASYALLGGLLLAVLSATSAAAGLVVAQSSTTAAVVVTVLCTLAVPPARRRLSARLGRRLYPARERAVEALQRLQQSVHRGVARPEAIEVALRQALRDPDLRVGYQPLDGGALLGLDGTALDALERSTPVRLGGEAIGVLVAGPQQPKPPPREVGDAAGLLLEMVRLQTALERALAEVEASRARMLRAGYDERRRLERDLHDGAQQRLVSLGMGLRVLQRTDPKAAGLTDALDQAVTEIGTAVAELRQIAHGLRLSSLDDGLGPALAHLIRLSPTPVELQVAPLELPEELSTTVYYVASEAVTNAVRYAEASRIHVDVAQVDGHVRVRIHDDGRGGAVVRPGAGLAGLRDRVTALGGRLEVATAQQRGTLVEAVLPCMS